MTSSGLRIGDQFMENANSLRRRSARLRWDSLVGLDTAGGR